MVADCRLALVVLGGRRTTVDERANVGMNPSGGFCAIHNWPLTRDDVGCAAMRNGAFNSMTSVL